MKRRGLIWLIVTLLSLHGFTQFYPKRTELFEDDTSTITLFLSANFKGIKAKSALEVKRPAHVTLMWNDSTSFSGDIEFRARGNFRFEDCDPPPLMLYFKTDKTGPLTGLGKLKLVWACQNSEYFDQLLWKEFLVYRIFNEITPYSFRVRRIKIIYQDSSGSARQIEKNGFFIEDIDDLARRNGCRELEGIRIPSSRIESSNYTQLAIFQYMIGNTDWGIPFYHNIKLVEPKTIETGAPSAIPYDFDFCGVVNANYAAPDQMFPIKSVRQRLYLGVMRDTLEINRALDIFWKKRDILMGLVEHMPGFTEKTMKDVRKFIESFYDDIENREKAIRIFTNPPIIN